MTVALAFKAFAKAIPCLTPFFARSDPSVLKRILAYIRGLPCSSNIFFKKVILTGHSRSIGGVGSLSGLPEGGQDTEISRLASAPALSERRHRGLARWLVAVLKHPCAGSSTPPMRRVARARRSSTEVAAHKRRIA